MHVPPCDLLGPLRFNPEKAKLHFGGFAASLRSGVSVHPGEAQPDDDPDRKTISTIPVRKLAPECFLVDLAGGRQGDRVEDDLVWQLPFRDLRRHVA